MRGPWSVGFDLGTAGAAVVCRARTRGAPQAGGAPPFAKATGDKQVPALHHSPSLPRKTDAPATIACGLDASFACVYTPHVGYNGEHSTAISEVLALHRLLYIAAVVALVIGTGICNAQTQLDDDIWTAENARTEATPSWYGETGLIVIPTTRIVSPQNIQAHYHSVDTDSDWTNTWGANVGLTSNIEAGVTRLDDIGETIFQAKVNLDLNNWLGLQGAPEVAVGCRDIGDEVDRALYVVLGKELIIKEEKPSLLFGYVGFGDTSLPGSPLDGVFGGVDFVPFDFMRVQIEHDGENLNADARYWWSHWFSTDVGWLDEEFGWGATAQTKF